MSTVLDAQGQAFRDRPLEDADVLRAAIGEHRGQSVQMAREAVFEKPSQVFCRSLGYCGDKGNCALRRPGRPDPAAASPT